VAFLEGYARALASLETKWERRERWLAGAITSTRPSCGYEPAHGRLAASPSRSPAHGRRDVERLANEIFALPGRLAAARGAPWWSRSTSSRLSRASTAAPSSMRCARRRSTSGEVGYVFAGSEPSLMEKMIGPRRPFYKAGPVMRLQKIPPTSSRSSSNALRAQRHPRRSPGSARRSSTWPATCPTTCSGWPTRRGTTLRAAGARQGGARPAARHPDRLLAEQDTMFEAVWQRLTLAQRAVLRAVVLQDGRELLSADTRARHRLGGRRASRPRSPRSSSRTCSSRRAQYVVIDSLLREWVARRTF
jgi:hypothetical protein